MRRRDCIGALAAAGLAAATPKRRTTVSIHGDMFHINGKPTYAGRRWKGHKIEGLLLNTRMVQGIFDDLNPETAVRWAYPDTKKWDAERNVREFLAAMPTWKKHGCLGFTINLQAARRATRKASPGRPAPLRPMALSAPPSWRGWSASSIAQTNWAWWPSSVTTTSARTSA